MGNMLRKKLIPDAIFAANDPVAIGAFQRIKEAGLKILKTSQSLVFLIIRLQAWLTPTYDYKPAIYRYGEESRRNFDRADRE